MVNLLLCLALCLGTISASIVVESQIQTSNWNNGSNSSNGTNTTSGYILSDFKWDPAYLNTLGSYLELKFVGIEGWYIPGKPHPVYVTGMVKKPFKLTRMVLDVYCNDLHVHNDIEMFSRTNAYTEGPLPPFTAFNKLPFTPVVGNCYLTANLRNPEGTLFSEKIATFKFEKAQ